MLSPTRRQVSYALLTRSPLYSRYCYLFRVRLACLIHAANVRSEPGSNSPLCYSSHHARSANIRGPVELTRDLSSPKTREGSFRAPRHMRALFVCQRAGRANLREFGCFRPNRELTNSTATCQCEKPTFQEVRTRRHQNFGLRYDAGPCSRPAGLRVHTLPAARRNDSRGILRCQPLLDGKSRLWG